MESDKEYYLMNWEDLRILNAAADTRSLSAAARRLGMSQPKMSRRLRALEDRLGARLFDRLPSGLAPTPAGERLIPLVAEMANAAEAVERAKPSLPGTAVGTVRVSAEETLCRFLAEHVGELLAAEPRVELELIVAHAELSLSRREADLLIRACLPDGASLIARRLAGAHYAVYGARDYVERHPAARGAERYGACDWVGFAEDRLFFPKQKTWLDRHLPRPPKLRATEMSSLFDALRAGAGLGLAPCYLGDREPALERLTAPIAEVAERYHLLIHRDLLREPAVRAVKDALVALFLRHRDQFRGREGEAAA